MFIDTNIDVPMSAPEGVPREQIFDKTVNSKVIFEFVCMCACIVGK